MSSNRSSAEHIRTSARTSAEHVLGSSRLSARMSSRMSSTRLSSRLSSRHTSNRLPSGDIAVLDTWLADFVARGDPANTSNPKLPGLSGTWSDADPDTRKRKRNSSLHSFLYPDDDTHFSFLDATENVLPPANTPDHCDLNQPFTLRAGASFAGRGGLSEVIQKGRRSASFGGTNQRRVARPDLPVPKMPAAVPDPDEPPQITKTWTDLERNFSRGRSTEPFGNGHLPATEHPSQRSPVIEIDSPLPLEQPQHVQRHMRDSMRQMSIHPAPPDHSMPPPPPPPPSHPSEHVPQYNSPASDQATGFGYRQNSAPASAQRPANSLSVFATDQPIQPPSEPKRRFLLPPSEAAKGNVSLATPSGPHMPQDVNGPESGPSIDLFVESLGSGVQPTRSFFQQRNRKLSGDMARMSAPAGVGGHAQEGFDPFFPNQDPRQPHEAPVAFEPSANLRTTGRVCSAPVQVNGSSELMALQTRSPSQMIGGQMAFGPGSSRKTKVKRYKSLEPSRHCHVCSRPDDSVDVMACSNLYNGICRKIVCEKCFERYQWDFASTKARRLEWTCTHCRNVCPEKACCKKYERTNLARHWKAKLRKSSTLAAMKN